LNWLGGDGRRVAPKGSDPADRHNELRGRKERGWFRMFGWRLKPRTEEIPGLAGKALPVCRRCMAASRKVGWPIVGELCQEGPGGSFHIVPLVVGTMVRTSLSDYLPYKLRETLCGRKSLLAGGERYTIGPARFWTDSDMAKEFFRRHPELLNEPLVGSTFRRHGIDLEEELALIALAGDWDLSHTKRCQVVTYHLVRSKARLPLRPLNRVERFLVAGGFMWVPIIALAIYHGGLWVLFIPAAIWFVLMVIWILNFWL
jgi:hypothetical protein